MWERGTSGTWERVESERERESEREDGETRDESVVVCVCVRASSLAWLCAVSRSLSSTFVPAELHCGAAVTRLLIGICPDLQICAFTASETRVCASCTGLSCVPLSPLPPTLFCLPYPRVVDVVAAAPPPAAFASSLTSEISAPYLLACCGCFLLESGDL